MKYSEAIGFKKQIEIYNPDKIKYLLGSEPMFALAVNCDPDEVFISCEKGWIDLLLNFKHPLSDFIKNTWDVIAFATKPVTDLNNEEVFPSIRLSPLFYSTTMTETELCLEAYFQRKDCDIVEFWNKIFNGDLILNEK